MFNAPIIFSNIKDLKDIWDINELQGGAITSDVMTVDGNTTIGKSSSDMLADWESIIGIEYQDALNLSKRRAIILSKLIYSNVNRDILIDRLNVLCRDENYTLTFNSSFTELNLTFDSISPDLLDAVIDMLDTTLPLNVIFNLEIIYNSYGSLSTNTHSDLSVYTNIQLRENELFS